MVKLVDNNSDGKYEGGPKLENQLRSIAQVELSPDRMKVFLEIAGLKTGQVVHIATNGITAQDGETLWYKKTWYTLNRISDSKPFETPVDVRVDPPRYLQTDLKIARRAGTLTAEWPGEAAFRLELVDLRGAVVARAFDRGGRAALATGAFPAGVYVLRAYGAGKAMRSKPMIF